MNRWVEIEFDCLPLRNITRWDLPLDASQAYREFCSHVKRAHAKHGSHNTYYLHHAQCTFHLTNLPEQGMIEFRFEGVVLTDTTDCRTKGSDLDVQLIRETCHWLTEPVVQWFYQTVRRAVEVEFDRYIEAGDLEKTRKRMTLLQAESDQAGGFLGMYL